MQIDQTSKNLKINSTFYFFSKDARLPEMLQRAMAAEAEASREARAKVMKTDATLFF